MSNISLFLKKNKAVRPNVRYAATKSLCDEDGKALEWEIKPLSTEENEYLRERCTTEIVVLGRPGVYREKVDTNKYLAKMIAASVIEPDLMDAELQDSYGVKTPEALIKIMVDNPGEYSEFALFIQKLNGFDISGNQKVEEAKN
jgi:hypothetical protein